MDLPKISTESPLIFSRPLSNIAGRDVYLKLECTQPSGSFKLRGIALTCTAKAKKGCKRFVSSSGGNAGLATAYAANKLGLPCHLFVPTYVPPRMLRKCREYGATVTVAGINWHEANEKALEECKDPEVGYIHPYEDPLLWEAYSAIVLSTKEALGGKKPSCFVVSVGGGGLLTGILKGLESADWKDVPVVAMETEQTNCFHLSVLAGKIVEIKPSGVAKTLGANSVTPMLMELVLSGNFNVISHVLPDKEAVRGVVRFADDHGILVEPSCGVSLATVYSRVLPDILEEKGFDSKAGPIVIVVCGGSDITPQILLDFVKTFEL